MKTFYNILLNKLSISQFEKVVFNVKKAGYLSSNNIIDSAH